MGERKQKMREGAMKRMQKMKEGGEQKEEDSEMTEEEKALDEEMKNDMKEIMEFENDEELLGFLDDLLDFDMEEYEEVEDKFVEFLGTENEELKDEQDLSKLNDDAKEMF